MHDSSLARPAESNLRIFSLAHLTLANFDPPSFIRLASLAGYDAVGLTIIPFTPDEPVADIRSPALFQETRQALEETGIRVLDIETVGLTATFVPSTIAPLLEAGASLGAKYVVAAGVDNDRSRLIERLAELCDLVSNFQLTVVLEFFPWISVRDFSTAASVVQATRRHNAGVLVDTLHFARSNSSISELTKTGQQLCPYVQISDAPTIQAHSIDEMRHAANFERLLPGDGVLNLRGILHALPDDIPVAVETPTQTARAKADPLGYARAALNAAKQVVSDIS